MERARLQPMFVNDEKLNREVLIAGLREVLSSFSIQSDARIEKRIGKEKLEEMAEDLAGLIAVGTNKQVIQKNERLALTVKMLRCLQHLVELEMKLPFSLNTLMSHFHLLEYSVDRDFPGYIRSGLIRYAVRPPRTAA